MTSIEQLKSDISDKYIDNFKQELWTIKSLVLLPIKKDIKKILTWQADLPQKFDEVKEFGRWKDIINFVTPDIANQIFAFMKEKRTEIETRKTEAELEKLKQEILTGVKTDNSPQNTQTPDQQKSQKNQTSDPVSPQDAAQNPQSWETNSQNSDQTSQKPDKKEPDGKKDRGLSTPQEIGIGAGVAATGIGLTYGADKWARTRERKPLANLSPEQIKSQMSTAIETMKKQKDALSSRLSTKQLKTLNKNIEELSKGFSDFDKETVDLLKTRDEVWGKLSNKILREFALDPKTLTEIRKLSDQFVGKSPAEIKNILKSNKILNVSDELAESFSKAASKAELDSMCKLLSRGTKLTRAIKTFKGAMLLDVAFLWFDVYQYIQDNKEADLIAKVNKLRADNKYTRANTQLTIAISSIAIEALLMCTSLGSAGGPVGTLIGLGVGAVTAAVAIGVDSLYFDVQDFYLQNKEDFLRQKKAQLNQAILQGLYNKKKGNTSLNEKIWSPEPAQKAHSLNDAIFSMLFIDELENGSLQSSQLLSSYLQSGKKKSDFESSLPQEQKSQFTSERNQAEQVIDQRIAYLKPFFEGNALVQNLQKWGGMQYLNDLIEQSRVFQSLNAKKQWNTKLDYKTNLANAQKEHFKAFDPQKLQKFQNLEKTSPELYQEVLVTANLSSLLDQDENDQNYTQNVKLVKAMQDWIKLTDTNKFASLQIPDSNKNVAFVEKFLCQDFDLAKVDYPQITAKNLPMIIQNRQERRWNLNISDDPLQNVMYRLASELYGYTGANEKSEIMSFFSENDANAHGLYYSSQRQVNRDRAIDASGWLFKKGIDTQLPTGFPANQLDAKVNHFMDEFDGWTSNIDTPTEAVDDHLQKEFENKLRSILKSELSNRTIEKQNQVKSQISAFVSKNAKNGNYVELPYFLLVQAKRAWLWDMQKQFFTMKNGKMETVMLKSELNDKSSLATERAYLTQQREKYSDQEQALISRVESAHKDLAGILSVESTFDKQDELDLPKEVEVLIADKYKEREKFKSDVLYYDASTIGTSEILNQYEEFATYFENLYTGILLSLSTFKSTNDIDSFGMYGAALQMGSGDFFAPDGTFDEAKLEQFPYLQKSEVKEFYDSTIKSQKVWSKSIEQLRKSEDSKEKALGLQASKLVLATMLGESLLWKNNQGKIKRIKIWGNWLDSDVTSALSDPASLSQKIKERLAKMNIVSSLDPQKVQNLIKSPVQIKSLTSWQKEAVKQTNPLQQKIESTLPEVVWQWKRGDVSYDPDKSLLKSRGNQITLKEKSGMFYLNKLDYSLALKDALRLANFANWAKQNYKGVQIAFEWEWDVRYGLHDALVAKNQWKTGDDIEIISQDMLKSYCSAAKDDTFCKRIAIWLTTVVK